MLLRRWRAEPHVARWWEPEDEPHEAMLDDDEVRMWIVSCRGRPFAYAQDYDPHTAPDHHFGHLPPGSRGIDQYIGEPDMLDRGHGSGFVRAHVERLFEAGAPAVGTDPHPENVRARAAYRKAGFVETGGPCDTPWGRVTLMEAYRTSA